MGEIPYTSNGTSQLLAVITGVLDIWCEMGTVTFSVCLLDPPLFTFLISSSLHLLHLSPWSTVGKWEAHFGKKCEVCLRASRCPGTWLNTLQPNGAMSCHCWWSSALLIGRAVLGSRWGWMKRTLFLFTHIWPAIRLFLVILPDIFRRKHFILVQMCHR